ncbi:MAG: hypothetical protein KAS32_03000, partial [Candidatus Peribacteraceae bacterium]|nr:hypothetical protein [Candidatus Peribacteraceae bacterium]
YFNYDGTQYDSVVSGTGDIRTAYYLLSVPEVSAQVDKQFYWRIELTNVNGTQNFTTSVHNQTISKVNFTLCDYSDDPQLFFKTFSTTSPTTAVPATFTSAWTIKDADGGTVVLSRFYEDLTEANSSWGFCIEPQSTNYTVSVDVTVDATDYTPTYHYIVDTDYSSTGENISLYLLNDTEATLTQLRVLNQDSQPEADVYITIQRYDQGTGTYYNVGMALTSDSGTDLAYLKWYDEWYRFIGVKDGAVLFSEGPIKISASPKTFTFGEAGGSEYEKFRDILYSLTYINETKNFILSYVDPAGTVSSSCLRVIKRNVTKDYSICEICEASNSATLYCNIAGNGNGTYIADYYATGSPRYYIAQLYIYDGVNPTMYDMIGNDNGTGMAIIFAGIIVAFFLITPALGVIGMSIGVLGAVALGFQPFDMMAFMGLVVVGAAVAWAVQK